MYACGILVTVMHGPLRIQFIDLRNLEHTLLDCLTDDEGTTEAVSETIEAKEASFGDEIQLWVVMAFVLVAMTIIEGVGIAVKR